MVHLLVSATDSLSNHQFTLRPISSNTPPGSITDYTHDDNGQIIIFQCLQDRGQIMVSKFGGHRDITPFIREIIPIDAVIERTIMPGEVYERNLLTKQGKKVRLSFTVEGDDLDKKSS